MHAQVRPFAGRLSLQMHMTIEACLVEDLPQAAELGGELIL